MIICKLGRLKGLFIIPISLPALFLSVYFVLSRRKDGYRGTEIISVGLPSRFVVSQVVNKI